MYPNDPQQQPQPPQQQPPYQPPSPASSGAPLDYLNQISPQAPKRPGFSLAAGPKLWIILAILAVVIVSIISISVNVVVGAQREPAQRLAARMTATQGIAEDAQENLRSSELRGLNSDLRIYFTNSMREIETPMGNVGIKMGDTGSSIARKEIAAATATTERLEDARLNAIYDRTYAREMAYQLETLLALMQQVYKSTNSRSLKTYLDGAYDNLLPTQQAMEAYNESTD